MSHGTPGARQTMSVNVPPRSTQNSYFPWLYPDPAADLCAAEPLAADDDDAIAAAWKREGSNGRVWCRVGMER
jgi:hypothetical protein